jgi:hypothetical protein
VIYNGNLHGNVLVIAKSGGQTVSQTTAQSLAVPPIGGATLNFTLTNLPSATSIEFSAYMDVNADGAVAAWEPQGNYSGNPVTLTADRNDVRITLTEPELKLTIATAVEVKFHAYPYHYYQVQKSTDLENWTLVGDVIQGADQDVQLFFSTIGQPKTMYRAVETTMVSKTN